MTKVRGTHYYTAEQQSFELPYVFINFCFDLKVAVELIILTVFLGLGDISGRVFTSSRFVNTTYAFIIHLHFFIEQKTREMSANFPRHFVQWLFVYSKSKPV